MLEPMNLYSGYDKELDDFHKALLGAGVDEGSAYEDTRDFSASLADEYMLLNDGVYSAVLAGYYHLWERDIKDLCKHMLRYGPVDDGNKEVTEQDIQNYKHDKLRSLLTFWGVEESMFHEINLLRLVVNTIKHSTGPSAAELLNNNSKYYYKLAILCNLETGDFPKDEGAWMLGVDDLKYFGAVLNAFWAELGKKIYV